MAGGVAAPEAEPDHHAAGRPLLVGLTAVRANQVVVPLRVEGHALPTRAGLGRRGNFDEPSGAPTSAACGDVDDVERGGLVIRHQHPAAVAERRDAGGLDHDVHPAVPKKRGRGGR